MGKKSLRLLFLSLPLSVLYAQTPAPNPAAVPAYIVGPLTEYSAAQPDTTDAMRYRRGERYNIPDPTVPELGETSEPIELQSETHFRRDPLPFDNSDAVVVGTVRAGQAYLSNDKRRLYSEFKVELHDVIKSPTRISWPAIPLMSNVKGVKSGSLWKSFGSRGDSEFNAANCKPLSSFPEIQLCYPRLCTHDRI